VEAVTDDDLSRIIDELCGVEESTEEVELTWETTLLECVDRNKELRDRNFLEPYELLVYEEVTDMVQSVSLSDLAVRYPWECTECRWNAEDVGLALRAKFTLWRQSVVASELLDEGISSKPCGSVVLCIPKDTDFPFWWIELKSLT